MYIFDTSSVKRIKSNGFKYHKLCFRFYLEIETTATTNMLASIIPYPQIMCISNYVVVLNDEYLRDDLKTASFKYGGKIKVVGYITNKVTAQGDSAISVFAGIGNSINALLKIFFENADEMYIVHPIAIYYDN